MFLVALVSYIRGCKSESNRRAWCVHFSASFQAIGLMNTPRLAFFVACFSNTRIHNLAVHVAKDGPSLAAAFSAASVRAPPSYEAVVLTSVLEAAESSCPVEVGWATFHCVTDLFFAHSLLLSTVYALRILVQQSRQKQCPLLFCHSRFR